MDTKVLKYEQSTTFAVPGGAQAVYRVTFSVGEHGPFTVELKAVDFTPDKIRDAIEKVAATIRAVG